MFKSSLSRFKIYAATAAVLFVLLIMLALSFRRFNDLTNANYWNVHTYQVLLSTSHLTRGLVNVQAGSRGFLQTGDENFLDPYRVGRQEFAENYQKALTLTRDNPTQQKRLQLLKRQYDIYLNGHIEPLLKMRRATPDTATAISRAEVGVRRRKAIMDAMRQSVATIEATEMELLAQRSQREQTQLNATKAMLVFDGALAVILALIFSFMLAARTRKMELLNQRLSEQMERRQKAEREAEVISSHNKLLLEAAWDGIAGLNRTGRVTFFNPAAEKITGWSEEEMLGKSHHDILHPKKVDGSPCSVEECPLMATLQDGKVHHAVNEVFWHKDDRPVPVEFTSSPLIIESEEDETHKQVGAVLIFRNITERKKTEATLQDLSSLVANAREAIAAIKLDGTVTLWNRASTKLYGYGELEIVGQLVDRLLPLNQRDELPALIDKITNNEAIESYQTTRMRKDGRQISVMLSLAPIKDREGRVNGVSIVTREISALKNSTNTSQVEKTSPS